MTIQRRFAPISGRFEPERVAGFAGIYSIGAERKKQGKRLNLQANKVG
jgi:hypothetical protein